MSWTELLGPQLLTKSGAQSTETLLKDKVVGLYFSAHWCGPCRFFTPELSTFYKKVRNAGKPFEIVFVSSDTDEKAFEEYYGEHPWIAMPYSDRDRKGKLSTKYKVRGIPTLVILDKDGSTISTDGRSIAMAGELDNFPWKPASFAELVGPSLISNNGPVSLDALKGKTIGLYFSAHWCPPCRKFSPLLMAAYEKHKANGLEIIYISADNSEEEFKDYYKTHPWLAINWLDEKARTALQMRYEIEGFPTLVMTNSEGKVYNADARGAVTERPDDFPWRPPTVSVLPEGVEHLNEMACAVLLLGGATQDSAIAASEVYKSVATEMCSQWDAADVSPLLAFIQSNGDDPITAQVRSLTSSPAGSEPKLLVLAIPEGGKYYDYTGALEASAIRDFFKAYLSGSLESKQMTK